MKLLLIEDDKALSETIALSLRKEGYEVILAYDGIDGLNSMKVEKPDLVILDVMLPYMDGFEVLKQVRKEKIAMPILMLTAKDDIESRVKGLDGGAEDYLVKPFAMVELFARIRVMLRRKSESQEEVLLRCGRISLYPEKKLLLVENEEVILSKKEYSLLEYFLWNVGRVLTKEQILDRVWGIESDASDGVVDVYVHYLRKKLSPFQCESEIETIRGIGYRMKEKG